MTQPRISDDRLAELRERPHHSDDGDVYELAADLSDARALLVQKDAEIAALKAWQPIETAPKDGTEVILWMVHPNAEWSNDPVEHGYVCHVIAHWIDHNGGGWTWHGMCGTPTHWKPLSGGPTP